MNAAAATESPGAPPKLSRTAAEDFLFHEARLLDGWKLNEWAALFTDDGEYLIPPLDDPHGNPGETLFLVYDDRHRLGERAKRLLKRQAHAEFPHSVVRRLVGNVFVEPGEGELIRVSCNFAVYRSRAAGAEVFPGHAIYDLVAGAGGELKIRRKRAIIDSDTLRAQRRVSIIL
ncbi:MAG TPA: aromatic-ring-hydroxylating dioxygenase subunit beta [Burkholderiaceae bacterium]|nr:aromatic-ring-hydroxylating dioxygenase subunit beta [Burkholderiaceae bacterium]